MTVIHNLKHAWLVCRSPTEECALIARVLERNLEMSVTQIAMKSGCSKATVSRSLSGEPGGGGKKAAEKLWQVLDKQLEAIPIGGTCAPVAELDELAEKSIKLEFLTAMKHPSEMQCTSFPDKVSGAWISAPGIHQLIHGFMILVDRDLSGEQRAEVVAHELEEIARHIRKQNGRKPTPPRQRPAW